MAGAYLVRMIGNKDIVGIYVAQSLKQLTDLIDENVAPGWTEYRTLPTGGIEWTGSEAEKMPLAFDEEKDRDGSEHLWKGAGLTQDWFDALTKENGRWKRFSDPRYMTYEQLQEAKESGRYTKEHLGGILYHGKTDAWWKEHDPVLTHALKPKVDE